MKSSDNLLYRNMFGGNKKKRRISALLFSIVKGLHVLCMALLFEGCKKYVEVGAPDTSINGLNIYTQDATAASVLTGAYASISNLNADLGSNGLTSISMYASLSADELTLFNVNDSRYSPYFTNNLASTTEYGQFWTNIYSVIFVANSAIEGLTVSTTLTLSVKQQLLGESKFLRAFCYFYLVNLYGDVPLALTTDYKKNSLLNRSSQEQVYQQIIADLKEAETLLKEDYLQSDALTFYPNGSQQRIRPNKWAAAALLARAYLYDHDFANAELQSSSVINDSPLYRLNSIDSVFLKNSTETIWSLQPVGVGTNSNTGEGKVFVLPPSGPNSNPNSVYLSTILLNHFDSSDKRRIHWVGKASTASATYCFPYKYKIGAQDVATSEYIMVLRLAEQYLIRAEARAEQNNFGGAQSDLNTIRKRAGLPALNINDKSSLIAAIFNERQLELFTEWGHRWFDLKRTGQLNTVMSAVTPQKGGTWSPFKEFYPVPQSELIRDPELVQNNGY